MSLEVLNYSGIFQSCSVMHAGSEGALRAWKMLEFKLPRHLSIAVLATKTALKHK